MLGLNGKKNSAGEKPLSALPEALELPDLGILAWWWNVNGLCVLGLFCLFQEAQKKDAALLNFSEKIRSVHDAAR